MKIEKVNNGFLITEQTSIIDPDYQHQAFIQSSFKTPRINFEERTIFEKWSDAQLYIRKKFGVCE